MADRLEFELDYREVDKAVKILPNAVRREMRTTMREIRDDYLINFRKRFRPYRGRSYPSRLQIRSRKLLNSFKGTRVTERESGTLGFEIFTTSRIAKVHEFGETIRPRRKKFLTIPLKAALTSGGNLKGGARLRFAGGRWITQDGRATFIRKGVIFAYRQRRQGPPKPPRPRGPEGRPERTQRNSGGRGRSRKGPRVTPLYVLKRSVTIKPRLRFFKTWDGLEMLRARRVSAGIDAALRKSAQ